MKKYYLSLLRQAVLALMPFTAIAGNGVMGASGTAAGFTSVEYNGARIHAGRMVVKVHPAYRAVCSDEGVADYRFEAALQALNVHSMAKKFRQESVPVSPVNRYGRPSTDLSLVYQLTFDPAVPVDKAMATLMASGVLVYAEPVYIHDLYYTPNDPNIGNQYAITKIKAIDAWDITRGDTNVVVGIVDSGTDWDHPDLQNNIAFNWNDPIDGVDNDNDGNIDNFRGWDVSGNDNDPMVGVSDHGSHVSGCASAVTDNGTGVAGPGFNCRFLPVKSTQDASANSIDNGYDGIYYAATHGSDVINCSWGRGGGPSQFEQDVIDFAVLDHDALVMAASGNSGSEMNHYPSSYERVLAVGSTTSTDSRSSFSNYGYYIDVMAPGSNIYSTVYNNSYVSYSGTSMACPVAAGGAALVRARFPWMNAIQAGEQLRITCDNIYNVGTNGLYRDKMGKGRINLFRAVTDSVSPGVVVERVDLSDRNDNAFVINDTIRITGLFRNLLRPTTNLVCSLSTPSTDVTILSPTFNAGVIAMMDTASNYSLPFEVRINPGTLMNVAVPFKITMTDGAWSDFYAFELVVNVDYLNIEENDVATSITSKGLIGYNESGQSQGLGFKYMGGPTILYEMGLMVGASGTQVSDNVRGDGANYDADFGPLTNVSGLRPGAVSDYDITGVFDDYGLTSVSPIPVLIEHRAYAWGNPAADRKYVMVEYVIRNNGSSTLNGLYGGLFADWDIPQYANNKAGEDLSRRMGYCWSTDTSGLWAGIKLLSNTPFNHYAIDNISGGGGVALSDGYDDSEKYLTLSTQRATAGNATAAGNDVIDVVSTGPFNLASGDSVKIAFALIAGENLAMIQASADAAQTRYNNLTTGLEQIDLSAGNGLENVYPNPASDGVRVEFTVGSTSPSSIAIYSVTGELVKELLNERLSTGKYTLSADVSLLPAGSYIVRMINGDSMQHLPLQVIR